LEWPAFRRQLRMGTNPGVVAILER